MAAPTIEPGNGQSGNPADFALRKLADRAQSLVEAPWRKASRRHRARFRLIH